MYTCVIDDIMVFNATFKICSAISWWSVLLVEETRVPGENHRHNCCIEYTFELTTLMVIDNDSIGSCKSNYHTITTAPDNRMRPRFYT
jgi:hypothetical protein